jgi:hypothetical protein
MRIYAQIYSIGPYQELWGLGFTFTQVARLSEFPSPGLLVGQLVGLIVKLLDYCSPFKIHFMHFT